MLNRAEAKDTLWDKFYTADELQNVPAYLTTCLNNLMDRVERARKNKYVDQEMMMVYGEDAKNAACSEKYEELKNSLRSIAVELTGSAHYPQESPVQRLLQLFLNHHGNSEPSVEGMLQLVKIMGRWITLYNYFARTFLGFLVVSNNKPNSWTSHTEYPNTSTTTMSAPPAWFTKFLNTGTALSIKGTGSAKKRKPAAKKTMTKTQPQKKQKKGAIVFIDDEAEEDSD